VVEIADAPRDTGGGPLGAPGVTITAHAIAGAPIQCKVTTQSTGGTGTIQYTSTWTQDGVAFPGATMTVFPGDTIPGSQTHTSHVFACTVTAIDGAGAMKAAAPLGVVVDGRFAFVTNQSGGAALEKINLDTKAISFIGSLGVPYTFGDLAFDPTTQTLFMVDGQSGTNLYRVDTSTGAATLIGSHGIASMRALGLDTSNGKLFGGVASGAVFSLNPSTAVATSVGGNVSLDGLTFDTKRGRLVGVTANVSGGTLWTINESTGVNTNLAAAGNIDNNGITYDPIVDMYFAVDFGGNLFQYDPSANMARTTVTTFAGLQMTAIALFIPPAM
jgi:hypothetical protein